MKGNEENGFLVVFEPRAVIKVKVYMYFTVYAFASLRQLDFAVYIF